MCFHVCYTPFELYRRVSFSSSSNSRRRGTQEGKTSFRPGQNCDDHPQPQALNAPHALVPINVSVGVKGLSAEGTAVFIVVGSVDAASRSPAAVVRMGCIGEQEEDVAAPRFGCWSVVVDSFGCLG